MCLHSDKKIIASALTWSCLPLSVKYTNFASELIVFNKAFHSKLCFSENFLRIDNMQYLYFFSEYDFSPEVIFVWARFIFIFFKDWWSQQVQNSAIFRIWVKYDAKSMPIKRISFIFVIRFNRTMRSSFVCVWSKYVINVAYKLKSSPWTLFRLIHSYDSKCFTRAFVLLSSY